MRRSAQPSSISGRTVCSQTPATCAEFTFPVQTGDGGELTCPEKAHSTVWAGGKETAAQGGQATFHLSQLGVTRRDSNPGHLSHSSTRPITPTSRHHPVCHQWQGQHQGAGSPILKHDVPFPLPIHSLKDDAYEGVRDPTNQGAGCFVLKTSALRGYQLPVTLTGFLPLAPLRFVVCQARQESH